MKKILVLFTGGTIGSSVRDGVIGTDSSADRLLISQYESMYGTEVGFECRQILNVLSENITLDEWDVLARVLRSVKYESYSGIIITHGSDTLGFTSAFVAMLCRHFSVPVILIAANKPLDERGTNGLYNFTCAVKLIIEGRHGIYAFYEKPYLATRLSQADIVTDNFRACDGTENGFSGVSEKMLERKYEPLLREPLTLDKRVLMLVGYPNICFEDIAISDDVGAVLYVAYHSVTFCEREDKPRFSFSRLVKICEEKGVPLCVTGSQGENVYRSFADTDTSRVILLGRISPEAAYAKLVIAVNQREYAFCDLLRKNIYHELLL